MATVTSIDCWIDVVGGEGGGFHLDTFLPA